MKKILVSLVGEQTIPNILVAAHYKPDILWFISTEKMEREKKTDCIKNTLKLMGLLPSDTDIEAIIVDQDSLTDCMGKIESSIDKVGGAVEYIINLTGGNKVMALAAYDVFREIGEKVSIDYVPIDRNEFIQIFPKKKPLKIYEIRERLNIEKYLSGYGFVIQNKNIMEKMNGVLARKETSQWIFANYEQIKVMLGLLYGFLGKKRDCKRYQLTESLVKDTGAIERELLKKLGFEIKGKLIYKELTKDETIYLTGGWFEEHVFNEVYSLVLERLLDDTMIGLGIKSLSGTSNDLDIAFMKDNRFYHIECKTLGNEEEQNIIRDEIYKKGAISTLLGKGERRAMICTTQSQINESLTKRAQDYGIEILTIEHVRNLKNRLKERFEVQK